MAMDVFKPDRLARGMMELHPQNAAEVTLALLDDALVNGRQERALMWWAVLVRVEWRKKKRLTDQLH